MARLCQVMRTENVRVGEDHNGTEDSTPFAEDSAKLTPFRKLANKHGVMLFTNSAQSFGAIHGSFCGWSQNSNPVCGVLWAYDPKAMRQRESPK